MEEKSWIKRNFWTLLLGILGLGVAARGLWGESELKANRLKLEQAEIKLQTQDSLLTLNQVYIDSIRSINDSLGSFISMSRNQALQIDEELARAKRNLGYDKINKNLDQIRSEIQDIQTQTPYAPIPVQWH